MEGANIVPVMDMNRNNNYGDCWGGVNLLEGSGQDNPGAKSQGVKQLVAGGGVALIGVTLIPLLSGLLG